MGDPEFWKCIYCGALNFLCRKSCRNCKAKKL